VGAWIYLWWRKALSTQNIHNKAIIIPGTLRKKFPWKIRSKKNAVCVVCRNRRHLNGWNPFSSSRGQGPLLR